ncbi:hypothetical protein A2U01_0076771, partial [Trifolium medium]|nr:hypothetical protein [Trifolium medium]
PSSNGWRMKVTLEELEEGLAGLEMKEEKPCPALDITNLKKEDLCPKMGQIPQGSYKIQVWGKQDRNEETS